MKNLLKNLAIFTVLIVITFCVLLRGQNPEDLLNTIYSTDKIFLIIGAISMFGFILGEAINTYLLIKSLGYKTSILKTLKYSFVGYFYSAITPSSSGGQPMQIYYMKKDGLPISKSTLLLLVELAAYQIISLFYLIMGSILNYRYLSNSLNTGIFTIFILGITISIVVLLAIFGIIFSRRIETLLCKLVEWILKIFKIKKREEIYQKFLYGMNEYREGANYIKNNKSLFFKIILVTFGQMTCFLSVAYFTYRAFGLSGVSYFKIISLEAFLYGATSSLPIPGAIGASEGGFKLIFKNIFGITMIDSAVLIFRFLSFYFYVFLSGIIVSLISLKKNTNIAKH